MLTSYSNKTSNRNVQNVKQTNINAGTKLLQLFCPTAILPSIVKQEHKTIPLTNPLCGSFIRTNTGQSGNQLSSMPYELFLYELGQGIQLGIC